MKLSRESVWAGASMAAGGLACLQTWGFSVDDAWILARGSWMWANTGVQALNRGGPAIDYVTPLGYAQLLGALGKFIFPLSQSCSAALGWGTAWGPAQPLEYFQLARCLGLGAYLASLGILGSAPMPRWGRWIWLLGCAASFQLGAWASAGLETGGVCLLVALALRCQHREGGAVFWGWAAAWRPELSLVLAARFFLGTEQEHGGYRRPRWKEWAWAALVPSLVVGARLYFFGTWLPLSFRAKEALPEAGFYYVLGAYLNAGVLLLPSLGLGRRHWLPWGLSLLAFYSLWLAGGDWMPLYRLTVPLGAWFLYEFCRREQASWSLILGALWLMASWLRLELIFGDDSRAVVERRLALFEAARPELRRARGLASVDLGWPGLEPELTLVDLSGIAEPKLAGLPGGHTSRHLSMNYLLARQADTWLLLHRRSAQRFPQNDLNSSGLKHCNYNRSYCSCSLAELQPVYAVDRRLLGDASAYDWQLEAEFELRGSPWSYCLLRRHAAP